MSEKFIVREINNFCRVFILPTRYPQGFCFGGGYQVTIQLIDWFNPVCPDDGRVFNTYPVHLEGEKLDKQRETLIRFIKKKEYYKQNKRRDFLVITNYGDAILIKSEVP